MPAAPAAVGTSCPLSDARAKVTGRARFTDDLTIPGMAHAALVHSPHPRARIVSVETGRAARLPGVLAIVHGQDTAGLRFGPIVADRPIFADGEARYAGEPVAGVVAADPAIAEEAARLIDVRYEPLPAATDLETALAPGAPPVHRTVTPSPHSVYPLHGLDPERNVCAALALERGDPEAALAAAEHVLSAVYRFPAVYHYALETYCVLARWGATGLEVWSSCQHPYQVRRDLAAGFDLPLNRVRVVSPNVGGGFGSKSFTQVEPIAAALARASRRPVRLRLSMEEAALTSRRHAARCQLTTGLDAAGRIVAHVAQVDLDGGAYAQTGPLVAAKAAWRSLGGYDLPNYRVRVRRAYTHTSPAGSFRAIGGPQAVWALESHVDELARLAGIDPAEFRLRNLATRGNRFRPGRRPLDADLGGLIHCVAAGADGLALGVCDPGARGVSTSVVRLFPDGSAVVAVGTAELGQGARTVLGQIAAQALDLPPARIRVVNADSDAAPYDTSTGASRSTTVAGLAVLRAAQDALRRSGEEERIGRGYVRDADFAEDPFFWEAAAAGVHIEVDPDTGVVELAGYHSAADVGRAINPGLLEGQEQGAGLQAAGHALRERMVWDAGTPVNATPVEYGVPRFSDIPDAWRSTLVENGDGPGPYGCKGAGEGAIVPLAPAVANALRRRTGVRLRDLPLLPERVWRALRDCGGNESVERHDRCSRPPYRYGGAPGPQRDNG